MKKILYLTNIETPYRVRFFNELAKQCELTVLYERCKSSNRNGQWSKSVEQLYQTKYQTKYLNGIKLKGENAISLGILKEIFCQYDAIIVGCFNSPSQLLATLSMRVLRKPYILNLDGEIFLTGQGLKDKLKRFFLKGASAYLVAGEKSAESVSEVVGNVPIIPYWFSSLSDSEIARNLQSGAERNDTILVIGQYFDYKGMDVALAAAWMDQSLHYKFVGMGSRTDLFLQEHDVPENVEVIPFLQKEDLEKEYQTCAMLVLPSRQECWGLVINEAASFGMPIVSTWGSGAAVEFLEDEYPQYLAKPGDSQDLLNCIRKCMDTDDQKEYCTYLLEKSKKYSIESSVNAHLRCIE